MPTPPISESDQTAMQELNDLHKQKVALEKFEELYEKYLKEMNVWKREEDHAKRYKELMEELDQERKMHVDELRSINGDINALETTIKSTENDATRCANNARTYLREMVELKDHINTVRRSSNQELLPDTLIADKADYQRLMQQTSISSLPSEIGNQFHHLPQFLSSFPANTLPPNPFASFPFPLHSPQLPHQLQESSLSGLGVSGSGSGSGGGGGGGGGMGGGDRALSPSTDSTTIKQQPAPMKTCNSCQQQIHRNAPICPMCKSKSRSKNPKKPKKRSED